LLGRAIVCHSVSVRNFFFGSRSILTPRDFFSATSGELVLRSDFFGGVGSRFFFASLLRVLVGWFLVVLVGGAFFIALEVNWWRVFLFCFYAAPDSMENFRDFA
jgi:hypothetical protein